MDFLTIPGILFYCLFYISAVFCQNNHTIYVGVTKRCPRVLVDVDLYDNLYLKSTDIDHSDFRRHEECSVSVITGMVDHGLCISVMDVALSKDVEILFQTNTYEPDKKIDNRHARTGEWCTSESLVTISVRVKFTEQSAPDGPSLKFSMKVQAVPISHIRRIYYMDSKLSCDVQHKLGSGEKVMVFSHRRPHISKELPGVCDVTFLSTASDEYEEICLRFVKPIRDCDMSVVVTNLLQPHWNHNETFNCMSEVTENDEFCSENKELHLRLTRSHFTNSDFAIAVESKRHTFWKYVAEEKREMIGVDIVRTIIYMVSIINATLAVTVAVVSFLHRNPLSSISQWTVHSVFYFPKSCPETILNTNIPNDQDHIPDSCYVPEKIQSEQPVI
ncbi:hypothetical protein LOTGIDRAFT_236315 [Lottia gigantea]|uniref:CUB domain-containing protein n=1 Tax=Lottia gigantea TaxID=225164 RepID=V4B736_LOTGI|nr:hypothetical protein LOTGIDRAFT_236315 [Lottia gigantea]ESO84354.1 hypothetical protein LOTGIDRAFT_236315 [Lottia gigantea]